MRRDLSILLKSAPNWLRKRVTKYVQSCESVGFFVSFPKSGRTWLRVMLNELDLNFAYKHDGAKHSRPRPFEELKLCGKQYFQKPVVFMSRDPRDTAVSGYFQKTLRRDGYSGTIGDFVRDPLHGIEKVIRYNLTWLETGAKMDQFLPITYEATCINAVAVLRSIVVFVGGEVSDTVIERVVASNTFDKMRKRETSGEYDKRYHTKLRPGHAENPESYKVRRGKVGGYVDYLSADDIAYCDELLERYRYFERLHHLSGEGP